MTRYHGGEEVKAGFYGNLAHWEIITAKRGEALPGPKETTYLRLPTPLLLLAGPMLGALMVVFLPLLGFVMLFGFTGAKLIALARKAITAEPAEERA